MLQPPPASHAARPDGRAPDRERLDVAPTAPTTWERLSPWPDLGGARLRTLTAALDEPRLHEALAEDEARGDYPRRAVRALQAAGLAELLVHDEAEPARISVALLGLLNVITARRSGSLGITVGVNSLALLPVHIAADPALLRTVGARVRAGAFSSMLLTELPHGSNLLRNDLHAERGRLEGGAFVPVAEGEPCTHYRLAGTKDLINGGTEHDLLITFARTRRAPPDLGAQVSPIRVLSDFTLFVIDRDASTVALPRWRTLPMRAADIAGVRFEDTLVPAERVVGKEGGGFRQVRRTLAVSRGGIACLAVGTLSRAVELAHAYARRRDVYGGPILTLGPIAEHLARVHALDRVAAALSVHAVAALNAHGGGAAVATACAKVAACALAEEGVREGARLLGGRALLEDLPYERLTRDVQLYSVFDGTSHVVLDELAAHVDDEAWRRSQGERFDPTQALATLRATHAAPPAPLLERLRGPSPAWSLPLPETLAALAALPGEQPLGGLAGAAEALLALATRLRASGCWKQDGGLRFLVAETYAELEALTAAAALVDPDRRAALGLARVSGAADATLVDRLAWRFAAGWLGTRVIDRVRGIAARAGVPGDWLPPPVAQRGGLDGCAADLLAGHAAVRRDLQAALLASST